MFIRQLIFDYWKKCLIFLAFIITIASSFLLYTPTHTNQQHSLQSQQLIITLSGDVNTPGTYTVPSNMNLHEVLAQYAKGIKTVADPQIEMVVSHPEKEPFKPISINRASLSELQNIPGVGPTKAKKILDFRNQNGPFNNADDLMEVPGFGKATVAKIIPYVEFSSK